MSKKVSNLDYYRKNQKYTDFLESSDGKGFKKYVDFVLRYSDKDSKILEIGCGTGIALGLLRRKSKREYFGIEISCTSVEKCLQKGLNCQTYNGKNLPYPSEYFDLVSSFNVLEHTEDPIFFLDESFRVLKKKGILIISCSNLLSITNNYHPRTRGVIRKVKNFLTFINLASSRQIIFEKIEMFSRKNFHPDDDAVVIANPISILRWSSLKNLKLKYWSCQENYKKGLVDLLDKTPFKVFLGASFFVFQKN